MVFQVLALPKLIHHRGLGGSQHNPFSAVELHLLVKLFRKFNRFLVNVLQAVEFALERELT